MGNIVTIQAASVQEQLQRIQQLREQQQQKKKQAAEAKREQALNAASQNDIIQKQVCTSPGWARSPFFIAHPETQQINVFINVYFGKEGTLLNC